jgi:serine/threonine protein kinase
MQLIDVNGKTTYKLTDLGVARQINPDESTSYSIRGTEEYVHPVVYFEVFPKNINGKPIGTRVQFLFEVEMWSFGVTIYQCSTGR